MRKFINIFFIYTIVLFLFGISLFIIIKKDEKLSLQENRYLTGFNSLKDTNYFDGTFQNTIESIYTDQFPNRYKFINIKNVMDRKSEAIFKSENPTQYIVKKISDQEIYMINDSDYMMYGLEDGEIPKEKKERFIERAKEINELQKRHPDIKIFVYVPTQIHETNLFDKDNEIVNDADAVWNEFEKYIKVPFRRYNIKSVQEYQTMFYKSDHHANHIGIDNYYKDIMSFMKPYSYKYEPIKEDCHIGENFYGTFGSRTGYAYSPDLFCVYQYNTVPFKVYHNNKLIKDYPNRKDFEKVPIKQEVEHPYYYNIAYPSYDPIMEFDTERDIYDNLMVIGDSYSIPLMEPLSSSFNKTFRVAPYSYHDRTGKFFDYDTFIEENNIKYVLYMFTYENYFYKDELSDRFYSNHIYPYGKKQ